MANPTIVETEELKIDTFYVDGDTRILTLKNPKDNISTSEIESLNAMIQANNLLIGDKTAATFGKIRTVTRVTKVTVDFSPETITP